MWTREMSKEGKTGRGKRGGGRQEKGKEEKWVRKGTGGAGHG